MKIIFDSNDKEKQEEEIYQFFYDNWDMSIRLIEAFLIDRINAGNPYEEFNGGDVMIMSKYDCGREVVLEYFDVDNGGKVLVSELMDKVQRHFINGIKDDIVQGGIDYCENNSFEIWYE